MDLQWKVSLHPRTDAPRCDCTASSNSRCLELDLGGYWYRVLPFVSILTGHAASHLWQRGSCRALAMLLTSMERNGHFLLTGSAETVLACCLLQMHTDQL